MLLFLFIAILAMMFIGVGNTFKALFVIAFAAVGAVILYFLGYFLLMSLFV